MILLHITDDFVLQPICLSKLKQKDTWVKYCTGEDGQLDLKKWMLYGADYKVALVVHALSWSIMIVLPFMCLSIYRVIIGTDVFNNWNTDLFFFGSVVWNTFIHAYIDHVKANVKTISLMHDQFMHFLQILLTFIVGMSIYF